MIAELERLYSPARWTQHDQPFSRARVLETIRGLNMNGSPGYPLCLQWTTNREMLRDPPLGLGIDALADLVEVRLEKLLTCDLSNSAVQDPIRTFIKREAHTPEKAAAKRWRIIWSIGVVDQVIDKLLWANMQKAEVDVWADIPTKSGYSAKYGTTNRLYNQIDDGGMCAKGDKSSWDITVAGWEADDNLEINFRLCSNYHPDSKWVVVAKRRHVALFGHRRIITSDGFLYRQDHYGVLPSGYYLTLLYNSRNQVMLKFLAVDSLIGQRKFDWRFDYVAAVGDDSLERLRDLTIKEYVDYVNSLGHIFNDFDVGKLIDLEFCSRSFHRLQTGEIVTKPVNWPRHIVHLCYREKFDLELVTDALLSLCIEYAYDDDKWNLLHANLVALNQRKAVSRKTCQYFVSGDESSCSLAELTVIKRCYSPLDPISST